MCERELETEQNCNILTPTLLAISVSFPFSRAAQPGALGPSLCECWFSLPHLISTRLIPNSQSGAWGFPMLGAGFLCRILSPTGLVSKLTDFLSSMSYIIVQRPPSCGRHHHTHSTLPRSRLYSDIPWADAPVIYIAAFPILSARPSRRSLYNNSISKLLRRNRKRKRPSRSHQQLYVFKWWPYRNHILCNKISYDR